MKKAQFISFLLVLILSSSSFAQYFSGPFKNTNVQYASLYREFFKNDEKVLKTWYHYTVSFSKNDQKYILRLFQPEKHILLSETRYIDKKLQTKDGLFLKLNYLNYDFHYGHFSDNLEQGKWKIVDTLGNVKSIINYVDGKKEGETINYYEKNILKERIFYKNDKIEGKYEMFHKNGKIAKEGFYKESKKEGDFIVYDSVGIQAKLYVYKNDSIVKTIINIESINEGNEIYTSVEVSPCFLNGYESNSNVFQDCDLKILYKFLGTNVKYPKFAQRLNVSGKIIASFVIEKNGDVNEVKVISGLCQALEDESVRVLKSMPRWRPGYQDGVPVRVYFTMPIVYTLE